MEYKTGDRVEILIGHQYWRVEKMVDGQLVRLKELEVIDMSPQLVGETATILYGEITQEREIYALNVDGHGHISWFGLNQIKII